ncbi:putative csep0475 effector protein [Erysiphe necator]|uniref:Putative csep0475 effector protein n=1 Tax=Uncinula necator TaxID=52586 RepID=A0A0B1P745_UNCNE|nr:putative csep0475 effector protein [Erysiphe necator]
MRSIWLLSLISSLYLAYVSALATPFTGTILETRSEHGNGVNENGHGEKISEKPEKLGKLEHNEGLRGMRCGPALYTPGNLLEAASKACKLMKDKKKTWGFIRYPLAYQPKLEEIKNPLSKNDDEKPEGPFYLYPILQSGEVYRFGMSHSPSLFFP